MCSALSEGDEWETLIRHPAVLYSLSGLVMSCPLMNRLITHLPVLFYFLLWVSSGLDSDFLGWATNVPVELCGSWASCRPDLLFTPRSYFSHHLSQMFLLLID